MATDSHAISQHVRAEVEPLFDKLQRDAFGYFVQKTALENGLVADHTGENVPASITGVGLALAAYCVAVERGWIGRDEAIQRVLAALRFFWNSPQGPESDATGYKGFYYHFLDVETGRRAWQSELSTIDTAGLLMGALDAAVYFDRESPAEAEIRAMADALYRRADWQWALNDGVALTHGWNPESGFLSARWLGYDEALFLYVLALGSPTHPLTKASYDEWTSTFAWKNIYGYEFVYAGPLFIHQYAQLWLDLRGIQDDGVREKGIDYFENTRRATYVQQQYAMRNPLEFKRYGEHFWGITASEGPGPAQVWVDGIRRDFYDYRARGAPYGPDDGTVAPWVVMAALPFAPEIVAPTVQHFMEIYPDISSDCGCKNTVNPTFPTESGGADGWISSRHYALNQGPLILSVENARSELLWHLMHREPHLVAGLRRAGFRGGWLDAENGQ